MTRSAHHPGYPVPENVVSANPGRIRRARLRHIHPLTHERQMALTRTARATRRCKPSPRLCPVEAALRDQMLGLLPNLRAFAVSLTNNPTWADDLVQDTILRAWASMSHFERGTNLSACLPMKSAEASDGDIYLAFNAAVAKVAKQLRRAKR